MAPTPQEHNESLNDVENNNNNKNMELHHDVLVSSDKIESKQNQFSSSLIRNNIKYTKNDDSLIENTNIKIKDNDSVDNVVEKKDVIGSPCSASLLFPTACRSFLEEDSPSILGDQPDPMNHSSQVILDQVISDVVNKLQEQQSNSLITELSKSLQCLSLEDLKLYGQLKEDDQHYNKQIVTLSEDEHSFKLVVDVGDAVGVGVQVNVMDENCLVIESHRQSSADDDDGYSSSSSISSSSSSSSTSSLPISSPFSSASLYQPISRAKLLSLSVQLPGVQKINAFSSTLSVDGLLCIKVPKDNPSL